VLAAILSKSNTKSEDQSESHHAHDRQHKKRSYAIQKKRTLTPTRVHEKHLVKHRRYERSHNVRQRGQRGILAPRRVHPVDRHRREPSADVARGVGCETVGGVAPDGDGVGAADGVGENVGRGEEVGGVEAGPDGEAEEEVL
jgi:hypothetical protein